VTNINSDIIVVFAGVNDYLSPLENKRFGDINDTESTAGYCGSVRYFMKQLKQYYGDRDIFFVTMYDVSKTAECTYSDVTGQLTLNDYIEVQRKLAKEYGFNIIELYNIGFMDCTDKESSDFYLRDGLHPKDNGNIVLGEHIAAELSLYYSQRDN
jgi:lysophospholipase L1-like esterase